MRFAQAYFAWKMRYAPDVEPAPEKFGVDAQRGEMIARHIHRQLEEERVKAARDFKP